MSANSAPEEWPPFLAWSRRKEASVVDKSMTIERQLLRRARSAFGVG
jgi:hypothetical protein